MRDFLKIFYIFGLSVVCSCQGTVDDAYVLKLNASAMSIDLGDGGKVEFTVTYDGLDVTDKAVICMSEDGASLESNEFTPSEAGRYFFYAMYYDRRSDEVEIEVVDSRNVVESLYERHVLVMEFTGAWCTNCPAGYNTMNQVLQGNDRNKEFVHVAAFHSDVEGEDILAVPETADVFSYCNSLNLVDLGYPSFCTDLRDANLLVNGAPFRTSLNESFDKYPAHCAVALSSIYDADAGSATITVKVASEKDENYRVLVLVVEDRITGWQGGYVSNADGTDYLHRHVVREVVTSYGQTFSGEKLSDSPLAAGQEIQKSWTLDVDGAWELENVEIYAAAIDARGYVNNMNVCPLVNGSTDYDLK